jgi:hypothetical protein
MNPDLAPIPLINPLDMPKVSVDLSYFNNHLTTPWYFDVSTLSLP